jgi:osmotically-inducible protein OsmY
MGQRLDNAIDRTQHELARAGEKAQQRLAEAGAKTERALSEASEKTHEKVAAASATSPSSPSPGAKADGGATMSDAAITASIKTDYLKDPDLSVLKIDVDTRGGVVTLNGLASDDSARTRAERIASAIKGVREVRNFLVVKRA